MLCKFINRHFFGFVVVEDLAVYGGIAENRHESIDDVIDVSETTALVAGSIHGDRTATKRLLHERWHDHSVLAGLAWPHGIEKPQNGYRQLHLARIGQRKEFVD